MPQKKKKGRDAVGTPLTNSVQENFIGFTYHGESVMPEGAASFLAEQVKKEAEEERQRAREAAGERVLREFEKGQLGLAATSAISTTAGSDSSERTSRPSIVLFHLHVVLHLIRMNDAQLVVRSGSSTLTRQRWRGSPGRRRRLLSGRSSASKRRR